MTNKPIIIAICGKSATGKDTLLRQIKENYPKGRHCGVNVLISDTTRPIRLHEKEDVDYHFISEALFEYKIKNKEYLEYSEFNHWFYGTPLNQITEHAINVGIFNPEGIKTLGKIQDRCIVVPIYLEIRMSERIRRSCRREHKFKLEYVRRAFVDVKDFKDMDNILQEFPEYIVLRNERLMNQVSVVFNLLDDMGSFV